MRLFFWLMTILVLAQAGSAQTPTYFKTTVVRFAVPYPCTYNASRSELALEICTNVVRRYTLVPFVKQATTEIAPATQTVILSLYTAPYDVRVYGCVSLGLGCKPTQTIAVIPFAKIDERMKKNSEWKLTFAESAGELITIAVENYLSTAVPTLQKTSH